MSERGPSTVQAEVLRGDEAAAHFNHNNGEVVDAEIVDESNEAQSASNVPHTPVDAEPREPGTELMVPPSKEVDRPLTPVPIFETTTVATTDEPITSSPSTPPKPITFVTVDQSVHARQMARDAAERRLTEELNAEGSFIGKMFRKAVKGNMLYEYYRHKYTVEAENRIRTAGDIYINDEADQALRNDAQSETLARFVDDQDELIHRNVGEEREELKDSPFASATRDLIGRRLRGEIDDDEMTEEHTRNYVAHAGELHGDNAVRIDSLIETVRAGEAALAHGEGVESIVQNMRIISGETRSEARTESRKNALERTMEKVERSKLGFLVSPEVITVAAGAAYSIARWSAQSAGSALTRVGLVGLGAGLLAGLRESGHVKNERAQHIREMTYGDTMEAGDRRRQEMEKTRYEAKTAGELTELLERTVGEGVDLASQDAVDAALAALVEVEARIAITDRSDPKKRAQLVKYSKRITAGREQRLLDIARGAAKDRLAPLVPAEEIRKQRDLTYELLQENVDKRDEAFKKLKRKRVGIAIATAVVMGGAAAIVSQEVTAALPGIGDTRAGLLEQAWGSKPELLDGTQHDTILAGAAHDIFGSSSTPDITPAYHDFKMGDHTTFSVPNGEAIMNPDGTFDLKDASGTVIAAHLGMNPDGTLPNSTLENLQKAGIYANQNSVPVETQPKIETIQGSAKEYIEAQKEKGNAVPVTREKHMVNAIQGKSDLNELRMDYGGIDGKGFAADGSVEFNVNRMTAGGSFNGADSVDWHQAAEKGELKLFISPTGDTQKVPIMVDVGVDGKPQIAPGSPAAAFFSKDANGEAVFNGKYAEIAETKGTNAKGETIIRPLATLVGTDTAKTGTFTIERSTPQPPALETTVTFSAGEGIQGILNAPEAPRVVDIPPVTFIEPRRPLEQTRRPEAQEEAPTEVEAAPIVPPTPEGGDIRPQLPPAQPEEQPTVPVILPPTRRVINVSERVIRRGETQENTSPRSIPPTRRERLQLGPAMTQAQFVSGEYRGRGVGREEIGPNYEVRRAPRRVFNVGASTTSQSTTGPTDNRPRTAPAQEKKNMRYKSPAQVEMYISGLEKKLNDGEETVEQINIRASGTFGRNGYRIINTNGQYTIKVYEAGMAKALTIEQTPRKQGQSRRNGASQNRSR